MIEAHEVADSRSIHERSGQTIAAAQHQMTVETVGVAARTVCAPMWCYTFESLNRL